MSFVTAPAGAGRMAHADGSPGVAAAAAKMGIPSGASHSASHGSAAIAEAAPKGRRWKQLYNFSGREDMAKQIQDAKDYGFEAVIATRP